MILLNEPDTHYENHLLVNHLNSMDIGDINHGRHFVSKFVPHLAQTLRQKLITFLSTKMKQTGQLPTGKILSDSSTTQHRTRQYAAFYTCVPDSEKVIQAIYLTFTVLSSHTGSSTANAIVDAMKIRSPELVISPSQYLGISGDGNLIHCSTHEWVDEVLDVPANSRHHDADFMHRAGRVDINIRNRADKKFQWLVDLTSIIGDGFKFVNYGNEFEEFFQTCETLREDYKKNNSECDFEKMYVPVFYSATRYTNSVSRVFKSAYYDFPGLMLTLEKAKEQKSQGTSEDRKVAMKADEITNNMNKVKFAAQLAGMTDIYAVFNSGLRVLQMVNCLPHERYDKFQESCISVLSEMLKTLEDHDLCNHSEITINNFGVNDEDGEGSIEQLVSSECENGEDTRGKDDQDEYEDINTNDSVTNKTKCLWTSLHKEIPQLQQGKFRGKVLAGQHKEFSNTREGKKLEEIEKSKDQIKSAIKNIREFALQLYEGLEDKVFDTEDKKHIELVRPVTNLKRLAIQTKEKGYVTVYNESAENFYHIAKSIAPMTETFEKEILFDKYKVFLNRIHALCINKEDKYIESLDILKDFIDSKKKLYENIEPVIYIITTAAVSVGVESIVESIISVFKARTKNRRMKDTRADDEMMIKLNGPPLSRSDKLLENALQSLMGEKDSEMHFIRGKRVRKNWIVSKVLDRKMKEPSKLPFMI